MAKQLANLKIDKGIPIPKSVRPRRAMSVLDEMEIGDSFFRSDLKPSSTVSWATTHGRRHGQKKFITRRVTENGVDGVRVWRIK